MVLHIKLLAEDVLQLQGTFIPPLQALAKFQECFSKFLSIFVLVYVIWYKRHK